jgi:hypothetical protein
MCFSDICHVIQNTLFEGRQKRELMITGRNLVSLMIGVAAGLSTLCLAQAPIKYQPTLDSLNSHPLPEWYAKAKVGIFVCWGPYSVPGWAPLSHPDHDFNATSFIINTLTTNTRSDY